MFLKIKETKKSVDKVLFVLVVSAVEENFTKINDVKMHPQHLTCILEIVCQIFPQDTNFGQYLMNEHTNI